MKALNAVAITLWVFAGLFLVFIILWNYSRQTVLLEDYRTVQDEYNIGDEIFVTSKATVFMDGYSVYDHRLKCDKGRYLLKTLEVQSTPRETQPVKGSVGIVPDIPRPDTCVVITIKCHEINVIFGISRVYCNEAQTNRFKIL